MFLYYNNDMRTNYEYYRFYTHWQSVGYLLCSCSVIITIFLGAKVLIISESVNFNRSFLYQTTYLDNE